MCTWKGVCLAFLMLGSSVAHGSTLLTFEGLADSSPINDFYDGGAGGNLGITFNIQWEARIDSDAGGTGDFGGEPSPSTVALIRGSHISSPEIHVAGGFTGQVSFYYSSPDFPIVVDVIDQADPLHFLAFAFLPATPGNGSPDPTGFSGPFVKATIPFEGVGGGIHLSFIDFTAHQPLMDNIEFGEPNVVVPEGGTCGLLTIGLWGLWSAHRRKSPLG